MKQYTCWVGNENKKDQVLAEGYANSAKQFKAKIEQTGKTVCSRITIKKGLRHPL